jgi:hypothetical protein
MGGWPRYLADVAGVCRRHSSGERHFLGSCVVAEIGRWKENEQPRSAVRDR